MLMHDHAQTANEAPTVHVVVTYMAAPSHFYFAVTTPQKINDAQTMAKEWVCNALLLISPRP